MCLSSKCNDVSCFLSPPVLVHLSDLLMLLLPIFLVSTLQQEPHLKVRNFRKTASKVGAELARSLSGLSVGAREGVGQEGFGDFNGEQTPSWDGQHPKEQALPRRRPVVGVSSPETRKIPAASP